MELLLALALNSCDLRTQLIQDIVRDQNNVLSLTSLAPVLVPLLNAGQKDVLRVFNTECFARLLELALGIQTDCADAASQLLEAVLNLEDSTAGPCLVAGAERVALAHQRTSAESTQHR